MPLYEKYIAVIYALGPAHEEKEIMHESAGTPTSHCVTDPTESNAVCCSKPNLPNQTGSNAALLPCLTHQLSLVHEWSGVWN